MRILSSRQPTDVSLVRLTHACGIFTLSSRDKRDNSGAGFQITLQSVHGHWLNLEYFS